MLINCKPGCSGKKGTTQAKLDVASNDVICEFCGDCIEVTSFVKSSMKQQGDIVRLDERKSFQFECLTCEKPVQTQLKGTELVGRNCNKDCKFNVSKFTIHAMQKAGINTGDDDNEKSKDDNLVKGKISRRS